MTESTTTELSETTRAAIEPMDPQLRDIQPGGGIIIHLEQAWGGWRRWWLRTFRKGYVEKMRACRRGEPDGVPHEVLDPRDLKFHRNQTNCHWVPEDDPFAWRDRLPFARAGLAELFVFSAVVWTPLLILIYVLLTMALPLPAQVAGWVAVAGLGFCAIEIPWFFRDPRRKIPTAAGDVVSPADGKVVHIEEVEDEFIGGPAIEIGIFLSIFNVHINRAPVDSRVIGLRYKPGKYLNALRPESARENEQLATHLEENASPHRRMIVRQITGALARRIVCWLKPGDDLSRGEIFGMIKLGSRTELLLPKEDALEIVIRVGDTVKAGSSVLARYGQDGNQS